MALLSVLRDFIGHGVGGGNKSRAERTLLDEETAETLWRWNTREEGAAQRKKVGDLQSYS